jgi:plastocyanin
MMRIGCKTPVRIRIRPWTSVSIRASRELAINSFIDPVDFNNFRWTTNIRKELGVFRLSVQSIEVIKCYILEIEKNTWYVRMVAIFRIKNHQILIKNMSLVYVITLTVTPILGIFLLLPSTLDLDFNNKVMIQAMASSQNQSEDNTTMATATNSQVSSVAGSTNKTFYLENSAISGLNETKLGIPPDIFSLPQMTVEQGDNVIIHFYNLEDPGGDEHSFTLVEGPYNINKEFAPQENGTITFNANQTGVFQYICEYHPPTMTGQLIVLPKL